MNNNKNEMHKTKLNRALLTLIAFGGILCVLALPCSALAESPWVWQDSLKIDKVGDSMYMPSTVAFDTESERYYVVDNGRSRLVSFGRDGKFIRAFTANDQLRAPFDMIRLDNGRLWVVEKGRNSLTMIDIQAKLLKHNTLMDGNNLVFPDRIAFFDGRLYVLDRAKGQVLKLAPDLSVEQHYVCAECTSGFTDFVIHEGNVLALEPRDKKIFRFNKDGTVAGVINLGSTLDFPVSLDVGPSGSIYVLDRHQNSVFVYDETGGLRYNFLSAGQAPGKVYFASLLRFDPWDRLCVVDEGNGRVEIFGR